MGILSKKIVRYIFRNLGQFFAAVTVVMCGIVIYVAMNSSYSNLKQAKDNFYSENNFADYYFHCVKAPDSAVSQIANIPGVRAVTGRIQKDLSIIKKNEERATARIISYNLPDDNELNKINIIDGRIFVEKIGGSIPEVVLDPRYYAANHLKFGDEVSVIIDAKEKYLIVAGVAIGPEFIYAMENSSDILPDPEKFGIFILEKRQAQQLLNMNGEINQLLVQFEAGSEQNIIIEAIKEVLRPYGLLASFPRSDQLSNAVIDGELKELSSVATVLPLIFLSIAASVQFIILRRMINNQRSQIGLMKGLGYHGYEIIIHYIYYALTIAFAGVVVGVVLGIPSSNYFSKIYNTYFNLPGNLKGIAIRPIILGLSLCLLTSLLAALTASREIVGILPSSAMRPEPPKAGTKSWLERHIKSLDKISVGWKMTIRNMFRNKVRTLITQLVVIFAVGLLVCSFFLNDAADYMMRKTFYESQSYDMTIRFDTMQPERELLNIGRIDGVQRVEAFMEIPVRIYYQGRYEDDVLIAYDTDLSMKKLENTQGEQIHIPAEGLLLNQRTKDKLGVASGETVEIETLLSYGQTNWSKTLIFGSVNQMIGAGSYIDLQQANQIMKEQKLVSGAMLKVDQDKISHVETEINKMLEVSSVLQQRKEVANWEQLLQTLDISTGIISLFGILLGLAIVYNSSVMNMSDRRREIGYMRAIGFSSNEISRLLFRENIIYLIFGTILGLPFGRQLVGAYMKSVENDLYTLPIIIYPRTYVLATVGGIIFILIAHFLSTKEIKKMDLVEVLKSPE